MSVGSKTIDNGSAGGGADDDVNATVSSVHGRVHAWKLYV